MWLRKGGWIILTLLLASVQIAGAAPLPSISLEWSRDAVRVERASDGMFTISLQNGVSWSPPGSPDLPWVCVTVPVPAGSRIGSWRWFGNSEETLAPSIVPEPTWQDRPTPAGGPRPSQPDPAIYQGHAVWPEDQVRFQGCQAGAGVVRATFFVCPFRWDPVTHALSWNPSGRLEVELVAGDAVPGLLGPSLRAPETFPAGNAASGAGRAGTLSLRGAASPRLVHNLAGGLRISSSPSLDSAPVDFVIVTDTTLVSAYDSLVAFKNQSGFTTAVRTVQWIDAHYPTGVDLPERIRLFLRDAYLYWGTKTVVLGADPTLLPIRYARDASYDQGYGGDNIATDYYYACLDGNWNADGNNVYGQAATTIVTPPWPGDHADLIHDIKVGRISAKDPASVQIYLGKYMTYMKRPNLQPSYLTNILTMGEVLFDEAWRTGNCDSCDTCPQSICVKTDGETYCTNMINTVLKTPIGADFTFDQLYERDYWWNPKHPTSPAWEQAGHLNQANVTASIMAGRNVLFHMGHGDRDRWAIGDGRLLSSDVSTLKNAPLYPGLTYAINCNSAAVDADCLGEAWQFAPHGGGLDYIGSTNLDFPTSADAVQRGFFQRWLSDYNSTPGDAFYATEDSIGAVVGDTEQNFRWLLFSVIFLGDPDMPVWKSSLGTLAVTNAPGSITLGQGPVTINVTLDGNPVAGARVCLYKPGDAMAVALTDPSGAAVLPFAPSTTGPYSLTVTDPQAPWYQLQGNVIAPSSKSFASLSGYTVSDDGTHGSQGNGNGQIEVGETIALNLSVENQGNTPTSNLRVQLMPDSANGATLIPPSVTLTLIDSTATLGTIQSGGLSQNFLGAFVFQVTDASGHTPGAGPMNLELPMKIVFTAADGQHVQKIAPRAFRSDLLLTHTTFTVLNYNGAQPDTLPHVGETIALTFELYNRGGGTASRLRAVVTPVDTSMATMYKTIVHFPDLAPWTSGVSDTCEFLVKRIGPLFGFKLQFQDTLAAPIYHAIGARQIKLMSKARQPTGLSAVGAQNSLSLTWNETETTAWGYRLYRRPAADTTAAWVRAAPGFVESVRTFTDEGLAPLTLYQYKVAAVDSSGVESVASDSIVASTTPPDLSGWPNPMTEARDTCPVIENIKGWAMTTGGDQIICPSDAIYVFEPNGGDYYDGDNIPSTRGPLNSGTDASEFWDKAAVFDIDGDGQKEVVAVASNVASGSPPTAVPTLCVFETKYRATPSPAWLPGKLKWKANLVPGAFVQAAPAIGHVGDTPGMDIVVVANQYIFAFHNDGTPIRPKQSGVPAGVLFTIPGAYAFQYGSVALADLDGDGKDEIIFSSRYSPPSGSTDYSLNKLFVLRATDGAGNYAVNYPGFPYTYNPTTTSPGDPQTYASPAVGDIGSKTSTGVGPPDGKPDIVISTTDYLWAFDPNYSGGDKLMWRTALVHQALENPLTSSPALGDVDGDGNLDVVVGGGYGSLYVLNGETGQPLPGFTHGHNNYLTLGAATSGSRASSPILADLDGQLVTVGGTPKHLPEVIAGTNTGQVFAFRHDGSPMPGFPISIPTAAFGTGLAVWDVNHDGHPDLVLTGRNVNQIYVYSFPGTTFDPTNYAANPWTQFRHDTRNTGYIVNPPVDPTPVETVDLESQVTNGLAVNLSWSTSLGWQQFVLERRLEPDGEWEPSGTWPPTQIQRAPGAFQVTDQVPSAGTWDYRLSGVATDGSKQEIGDISVTVVSTGALAFRLHPPQPNPSNRSTEIRCDLPATGNLEVRIVDVAGRTVKHLISGPVGAGSVVLTWNGANDSGHPASSGIYFVKVQAGRMGSGSAKIVLLR